MYVNNKTILQEYEVNAGKYNSTLAEKSTKKAEKLPSPTLAETVQKQVTQRR